MAPELESERAKLIQRYVEDNKKCEISGRREPFVLNGEREDLVVYKFPLDLLRYNIQNGRFAAELKEEESKYGRLLNPDNEQDAFIIEKLLLAEEDKTEWMQDSLKNVGQLYPGVVTHDGYIIDGNRRAAVLKNLHKETGSPEYEYFLAVRLPPNVSSKDLWRIEAGIQLSTDLKVSYGPINELLKIQEGKNYHLTYKEIALSLGGAETAASVEAKLQRLELIENYLEYFKMSHKYSEGQRKVEHFIDLQNIQRTREYKAMPPEEQARFIEVAYWMIYSGFTHLQIRSLRKIVKDAGHRNEFLTSTLKKLRSDDSENSRAEDFQSKVEEEIETIEETIEEQEDQEYVSTEEESSEEAETPEIETTTKEEKPETVDKKLIREAIDDTFSTTLEAIDNRSRQNRPNQLIERVKNSLITLNAYDVGVLEEHREDIIQIVDLMGKLRARMGG